MAQHYKDQIAWEKVMGLVSEDYAVTDCFPEREVYRLTDQIRRAINEVSHILSGLINSPTVRKSAAADP